MPAIPPPTIATWITRPRSGRRRQRVDERRVRVHGARAREAEAERGGRPPRLDVEVVEHLDVVADEADRRDDDLARAVRRERAERVVHVGLEPRIARVAAPALVRELPAGQGERRRRPRRRLASSRS
jgi:hypothetical protein